MQNLNELYYRFLNGESLTTLSLELDVSRETLTKRFVKECGYERKQIKSNLNIITSDILMKSYHMYVKEEKSINEIAKYFNINRKSLSKKLKTNYNLYIRKDGKKNIDSNAFTNINNDSAYWLGVMLTDGYINKSNGFELCLKDKEHIEKFKSFLKSKHKLQKRVIIINNNTCEAYRLSIKDNNIVKNLIELGCVNNKSFLVRLPQLEQDVMSDLIRGIFDGDGCISISSTNRKQLSICSASKLFLEDIKKFLFDNDIVCTRIFKSRNLYSLNISVKKDNFIKFYDFLYKNCREEIRLNRKYEKYKANLPS